MKEYLIGLGIDGDKLFKNFKDTLNFLEQVESQSGEAGKAIDDAFGKGSKATEEFDAKLKTTSKNLETVRELGKIAGKGMADALSGKNINTSDFEKKLSSFKDKLASITAKVDIELDDQKIRIFQQQIDGAKNEVEQLNVALNIAKEVLAGLDANSDEFKQLSEAVIFTESALNEFETEVVQTTEKSKSLKSELRATQQEMARLEMAGETGSQQFRDLSMRAGELKDQIGDTSAQIAILASDTKHFDAMISGVTGLVGAFTAVQGATALFGAENEELNEALLKVNGAMAVLQGLQAVANTLNKDSAFSVMFLRNAHVANTTAMGAETTATVGATVATRAFGLALKMIGIGLIIAGISALVIYWDDLTKAVNKFLPAGKTVGKIFDDIKSYALGVGNAILQGVVTPFKAMTDLLSGDIAGAIETVSNGLNVAKNFNEGFRIQEGKNNEKYRNEQEQKNIDFAKRELERRRNRGEDTFQLEQRLLARQMALNKRMNESNEELQKEYEDAKDKRFAEDAKKSEERRKKAEERRKKAEEESKRRTEDARKKAEEESKKNKDLTLRYAEEISKLEIDAMDEGLAKKLALIENERKLREESIIREGASSADAIRKQQELIQDLNEQAERKKNEAIKQNAIERIKLEAEANKEIALLKKENLESDLDLLNLETQASLDAINERYSKDEELRLKLIEATEKNRVKREKEIKEKYFNESLKLDEERAILGIELSSQYADKSVKTERQKQIAILTTKLYYAELALNAIVDDGTAETDLRKKQGQKTVNDLKEGLEEATNGGEYQFDMFEFLGLGAGQSEEQKKKLKKAINESVKVLSDFTAFMIENEQAKIDAKQEQIDQNQDEIDELEERLDDEKQLREDGLANNVEVIEAEIAEKQREQDELKRQQNEALEEKKKYQKAQLLIDTATQLSGLITSAVNIFEGFSTIPFGLGIPLAIGVIGLMFGAFAASKAKALQSINQQTTQHAEGGEISGRSHSQGGEKYYNKDGSKVKELEDGEFVVKKRQYGKFGKLVRAINDDDFSHLSVNDYALAEMFRSMGFDFDTGVGEVKNLQLSLMSLGYSSMESQHLADISKGIALLVESERNTPKSWIKGGYNYVKEGMKVSKEKINPVKIEEDENAD